MDDKIEIKDRDIDIKELEFPFNVRTRPGMYCGATDNPNVILREAVDNAIDESFGSTQCNKIFIVTKVNFDANPKQYYIVADNGRGIPIILDEKKHITKTKMALTILNAGSKFSRTLDTVSTGMNGVGISVSSALSEEFIICSKITEKNYDKSIPEVKELWLSHQPKEECFYVLGFKEGLQYLETAMTIGDIKSRWNVEFPEKMSTIVFFRPDPKIFTSTVAKYNTDNLMYLTQFHKLFYDKKVDIDIDGLKAQDYYKPYKFEFKVPISINTGLLNEDGSPKLKQAIFYVTFQCDTDMYTNDVTGSVNSLVVNRGIHLNYVRSAYRNSLKRYFNINHEYLTAGIMMDVIVMAGEVDFSSQTKENCVRIDGLYEYEVAPILESEFKKIFRANQDYFDDHVARLNEYAASLTKISAINKVKSMVVIASEAGKSVRSKLPSSVKDCFSEDRKECELYIVEGKSAGGSILKARDERTQAVIELRGVPLNSVNVDLDTLLDNKEMSTIISAIGVGVNEYFVEDSLRYGKVIIAADADPDGLRISSLLLGFFAKRITELVRLGHVYVLDSPFYKQDGKYIYPTDDIDSLLDRSKPFTRYKGLGEMSSYEASECLTGPGRRLRRVTLDNVDDAIDLLTSTYSRKQLMIKNKLVVDPYNIGKL